MIISSPKSTIQYQDKFKTCFRLSPKPLRTDAGKSDPWSHSNRGKRDCMTDGTFSQVQHVHSTHSFHYKT